MQNPLTGSRGSGGRNFRGGGQWNHQGPGGRGRGRRGGRFQHNSRSGRGRANGGRPQHLDIRDDQIEILGNPSSTSLNIAVEGCCHGELDPIYERLLAHEMQNGHKVDLLICCGDFQSFRNQSDFNSCSMPAKYRRLGSFPKYYSGEKKAPILTLFIGGNHEASQPLRELYYGGWAAPNIYYLGAAGVVRFGGIRIGGVSNIYKSHDYELGHHEQPPFDNQTLRSVYHVRNVDIYRMKCLSKGVSRVDIIASHDWPLGIEQHGNTQELVRRKPYFRAEIERNDLGSPPNRQVLDAVQPRWWFSAHLHVKFRAVVKHGESNEGKRDASNTTVSLIPSQVKVKSPTARGTTDSVQQRNPKQSEPEASPTDQVEAATSIAQHDATNFHALESTCPVASDLTTQMTNFLALDKCLPRRHYLSILHLECESSKVDACLEYDTEWLAVLRKTHHLNCAERRKVKIPESLTDITKQDIEWVEDRLKACNGNENGTERDFRRIPANFTPTVPYYSDPCFHLSARVPPLPWMGNPQTDFLLQILELDHIVTIPFDTTLTPQRISSMLNSRRSDQNATPMDENEIDIDGDGDERVDSETEVKVTPVVDDNEIDLDDEGEQESTSVKVDSSQQMEMTVLKKARLDE